MSKGDARTRKGEYFERLSTLLEEHNSILIVTCDNVGSQQMHEIRKSLRGTATLLMGKNTMIRRAIRTLVPDKPEYEALLPLVRNNVGLVFTNSDLSSTRDVITANRIRAPAKAGAIAPVDVFVPPGNTGMEPGKTSFFQALGVPTKIARGTIEIVSEVHLVKKGNKVGPSEATLLNMLNISPFTYGLNVISVYDQGSVFEPHMLDIKDSDLLERFSETVTQIASLSLALGWPTVASVPHIFMNRYREVAAISIASNYVIPQVAQLKDLLDNPEKLAALQSAATTTAAPAASAARSKSPAKKEVKQEEKEESDDDMGFGLFD